MKILYHYFEYKFLKLGIFKNGDYISQILFLRGRDDLNYAIESKKRLNNKTYENFKYLIGLYENDKEFMDIDQQLTDYLDGKLKKFDIPYTLNKSFFIAKVLKETSNISYGTVMTYKEIALKIGNPNSYRAVGNALASNPVPIIIPCHRVIKSDGSIGGFGGTPELKRKLLLNEGVHLT